MMRYLPVLFFIFFSGELYADIGSCSGDEIRDLLDEGFSATAISDLCKLESDRNENEGNCTKEDKSKLKKYRFSTQEIDTLCREPAGEINAETRRKLIVKISKNSTERKKLVSKISDLKKELQIQKATCNNSGSKHNTEAISNVIDPAQRPNSPPAPQYEIDGTSLTPTAK